MRFFLQVDFKTPFFCLAKSVVFSYMSDFPTCRIFLHVGFSYMSDFPTCPKTGPLFIFGTIQNWTTAIFSEAHKRLLSDSISLTGKTCLFILRLLTSRLCAFYDYPAYCLQHNIAAQRAKQKALAIWQGL